MDATGTSELTVRHVLTMTMGIDWNEDLPYSDPRNGEIAMELAPDRYDYILSRPAIAAPGAHWGYCGCATALVGALLERGTEMTLAAYARERLFTPLGITACQWLADTDGRPDDAQVVPEAWVREAVEVHAGPAWSDHLAYGLHVYVAAALGAAPAWCGGIGDGGQYLMAIPEHDMVAVVVTGNYDGADQGREARNLLTQVIGSAQV